MPPRAPRAIRDYEVAAFDGNPESVAAECKHAAAGRQFSRWVSRHATEVESEMPRDWRHRRVGLAREDDSDDAATRGKKTGAAIQDHAAFPTRASARVPAPYQQRQLTVAQPERTPPARAGARHRLLDPELLTPLPG